MITKHQYHKHNLYHKGNRMIGEELMTCNNCKSKDNYSLWIRGDKILCSSCNDSDDLYDEMIDVDNIYYNERNQYDITGLIFILEED